MYLCFNENQSRGCKRNKSSLADLDAVGRIRWAWEKYGAGLMASTSFGLQSAVMIHLIRQVSKEIPIVFIDTGYLFPGTYEYALETSGENEF